jgi:hypothetical protein
MRRTRRPGALTRSCRKWFVRCHAVAACVAGGPLWETLRNRTKPYMRGSESTFYGRLDLRLPLGSELSRRAVPRG